DLARAEERERTDEVVLAGRLRRAVERLNPDMAEDVREQAVRQVLGLRKANVIDNNEDFHRLLTEGASVEVMENGYSRGRVVRIVDFEKPESNEYVVTNQFSVHGVSDRRPDIVLFVNGLPLVVIELKNPEDEKADAYSAYKQLQMYKQEIPALFFYNALVVASDGLDAKMGSLSADLGRFAEWRMRGSGAEERRTVPQIETMIAGMLNKETLLDLVRNFTVFEKAKRQDAETGLSIVETIKKVAAYHQYYAVNKAVASTLRAAADTPMLVREEPAVYGLPDVSVQTPGDRRAGVMWHTQGSGKSLSMVFYTGKLVRELRNPTVVVITDRNDLDDQLFETFAASRGLLRQEPVQVKNRAELKEKLKVASGGIVFTTIQKFFPDDEKEAFDLLSERSNIVVVADEAHRSQYGFQGRIAGGRLKYGFAKYIRDALPHATFIGFTGTPIEKNDKSTPAVFGNYIDIYDIEQAVKDGATVPIFYENRLVRVRLKEEYRDELDQTVDEVTERDEPEEADKAKSKWARIEQVVGQPTRLAAVARDIVEHFEKRGETLDAKAMVVVMSRRIAVALYDEIVKLRPEWHDDHLEKGNVKVVMTTAASDPAAWQAHHTTKDERRRLADRLKDPADPLKLVIVRDMWLTGFDAPCVKTMYVDKLMQGHNLMQAIARVNRVYKDIRGGLVVDYIGIARDLKKALSFYAEGGGRGSLMSDITDAAATMQEKFEIVEQMFADFNYRQYFEADTGGKLGLILEAEEHLFGLPEGKERFLEHVNVLARAYALVAPRQEAMDIKEALAFFQAVKARLAKLAGRQQGRGAEEIETAIRQIVDKALVSEGVIDIFDAAGMKRPEVSILSEEFLGEVRGLDRKKLALELLKNILIGEIDKARNKNIVLGRKFSEMLDKVLKRYHANILTAAEIIEEMINIARELRGEGERGAKLNLTEYEMAFYDALADNESAREVLGRDNLRDLACVLVEKVKQNASLDWTIRENVRAKLRVMIKRTLHEFGYPPDMQKLATELILKQAELHARDIFRD
ncbi:MAG: type I restriction endonuclease subunit R, partial [Candidatus Sungiibacteriota bacterium]